MKLIIAGSRYLHIESSKLLEVITSNIGDITTISEVVSGGASGIDSDGEKFASVFGIPRKRFSAQWDLFGKAAGPIRNGEMAKYADALLLIWDGKSKGSANMKTQMKGLKKPVFEVKVNNEKN